MDIHFLAYCYHWQESEIMNMTRKQRASYVQMVREQKEAERKAISGTKQ